VQIPAAAHYKDNVPTWKVGLNWTPSTGQYFYLFYARGYKSGGVNAGSPDFPTFNPEHVDDYELGWKGRLLDGHVLTQVGGYWMKYQNMQYQIFDVANAAEGDIVEDLAPSTIKGIEFSAQSKFGQLGFNMGADYNDSSLGSVTALPDYRLPPGFNVPVPQQQCGAPGVATNGCFNYTPYLENVSGERLPYAPVLTVNASIDYDIPVGRNTLRPRVTFSHTDKQWASIFQDSNYNLMGARDLWDASLDYEAGPWLAQVYGTNLAKQIYIIGSGGGSNPIFYGPPRQYGVRVNRNF